MLVIIWWTLRPWRVFSDLDNEEREAMQANQLEGYGMNWHRKLRFGNLGRLFLLWSVVCYLSIGFGCASETGRDFILALDTSGSMDADLPEGKMIDRVKKAMSRILDLIGKEDRVYVLSFDDGVQQELDLDLSTPSLETGKESILNFVESLEAKGRYTDMKLMVLAIREYLQKKKQEDREVFIIILSDGIDDPNPSKERDVITLGKFSAQENVPEGGFKDTFIYYLSVGILLDQNLVRDLEGLSSEQSVKTIEESEPEKGINQVIRELSYQKKVDTSVQVIENYGKEIIAAISILILAFLLRRYQTRNKLTGVIEYYDRAYGSYATKKLRLDRFKKHKLKIGSEKSADLRLKKLAVDSPIVFLARKIDLSGYGRQRRAKSTTVPESVLQNVAGERHVKYVKQVTKGVIGFNDVFSIGRYNFVYKRGKREKNKNS